jgi:hypothetical protein
MIYTREAARQCVVAANELSITSSLGRGSNLTRLSPC